MKCKQCRFWKVNNHTDFVTIENEIFKGECRCFPPHLNGHFTQFPVTTEDEWCGQFSEGSFKDHITEE